MGVKKTRPLAAKKIRLALGDRSYDIQIGSGIIQNIAKWLPKTSQRAFLVSDEKLTDARAATIAGLRKGGWTVEEITVQAGESLKDFAAVYPLYGQLLRANANRDSVIFALGGGTVGDAVGFVAATYLRGVAWVGVPTTLLAQVDSAIGGKTGINHELGKNLVGAFHQPRLVVCDTDFLKTLDRRDLVSGWAEIVKAGLVFDEKFFTYLEKNSEAFFARDPKVVAESIATAVRLKCKVVAKDEHDLSGAREVLNFGHTFGHALESATHYETFRHGEAVIWGMRFALSLSEVRKKISAPVRARIDAYLKSLEVPAIPADFKADLAFGSMSRDKKVRDGKIHFVLSRGAGKTVSDAAITQPDLFAAYEKIRSR